MYLTCPFGLQKFVDETDSVKFSHFNTTPGSAAGALSPGMKLVPTHNKVDEFEAINVWLLIAFVLEYGNIVITYGNQFDISRFNICVN